jgi:hypothetical protein
MLQVGLHGNWLGCGNDGADLLWKLGKIPQRWMEIDDCALDSAS